MTHITLVCALGMSTSMLMARMKTSAEQQRLEVKIVAMPEAKFASYTEPTDVLLLGPQIRFLLNTMKKTYEPKGIKVALIDMMDYGKMNGEKVLTDALALLK
jgi:cellobiose PTS system EIIB component